MKDIFVVELNNVVHIIIYIYLQSPFAATGDIITYVINEFPIGLCMCANPSAICLFHRLYFQSVFIAFCKFYGRSHLDQWVCILEFATHVSF